MYSFQNYFTKHFMYLLEIVFPEWDKNLFLYLNSKHYPILDNFMAIISSYAFWAICCIALILFMIYKDRRWGKWAALFMMGGVAANSIINNILKIIIQRPRPGHDPIIREIMHQLEDPGTNYSFFSAHASNSVCLALFSILYFRNKYYTLVALLWALLISYSRIYVGKHYPLDVACGLVFGLFTGWFSYWYYQKFYQKKERLYNQTIN